MQDAEDARVDERDMTGRGSGRRPVVHLSSEDDGDKASCLEGARGSLVDE